jgi:spore germination protein Q
MNTYFNKDIFPQSTYNNINNQINTPQQQNIPNISTNQLFLENILKINQGKKIKIYMTFPNYNEQKEFSGILEKIGNDYISLSDPKTGNWYLIPIMFLNYITFDENINY